MKLGMYLTVLVFLLMASCSNRSQKESLLGVEEMKKVMWDMMKADEWYLRESMRDSTLKTKKENIRLYDQVFAIHGITRNQFYNSFKHYEAHPLQFKVLIDSVEQYANRERVKLSTTDKHGQAL